MSGRVTLAAVLAALGCSGGAFRGGANDGRSAGGSDGGPTRSGGRASGSGGSGGSSSAAGGAAPSGGTGGTAGTDGGAPDGSDNDAGHTTGGSGNGGVSSGGSSNGGGGSGGRLGTGGSAGEGAGGAGAVSPLQNWMGSLTAAYFFEGSTTTLGNEANGRMALNLTGDSTGPSFFASRDLGTFIQGASSVKLPGAGDGSDGTFLVSALPEPAALQTPPGTSFTMGGWFRIDPSRTTDQEWLINDVGHGAYRGGNILALDQTPQAANPARGRFADRKAEVYCEVGSSDQAFDYLSTYNVGPDAHAPAGGWVHLICRHDAVANRVAVFVAGVLSAQVASPGVGPGPGPFMIGYNDGNYGVFVGNADDVFFTRAALTDEQIYRIYACGIDGARCRCQAASPTKYATCGFAQNGAAACPSTSLTPCNASLAPPSG